MRRIYAPIALLSLVATAFDPAGVALAVGQDRAAGAAAVQADRPQAELPPSASVALLIDSEPIDLTVYEEWLLTARGELMAGLFGEAIAIEREAARRGVTVDPAAVEAAVQLDVGVRVDNVFGGDRSQWVAELRAANRTEAGYLAQRRAEERLHQLAFAVANIDRVVPEEKIIRDWELAHGPRGVRLGLRGLKRSIELVATRAGLSVEERRAMVAEEEAAARAELAELRTRIETGETLAFLAKQHSDDEATAARGGLFDGPFNPIGWSDAMVDELVAMPVGAISGPHQGRGGLWLFEVVSRVETPLDAVRDELEAALVAAGPENDEINAFLAELYARTTITVAPALIDCAYDDRSAAAVLVDGEPVDLATYARWLRQQQGELNAPRFAEQRLIEREARAAGIDPSPEQIDAQVDVDRQRIIDLGHDGDEAKWLASLASSGRTAESWTRGARLRARVTVLLEELWRQQRVLTDEEVRNLWADRYGIDGVSVSARYIAKRFELPEKAEGESDRAWRSRVMTAGAPSYDEIVELSARVEDGEDFAALAKRYSDDRESAALGGVPPGGFDLTRWEEAARTAVGGLKPGELSVPVFIDDTVYLFEVTSYVRTPFEDVAAELRRELEEGPPAGVTIAAFRNVLARDLKVEPQPALFE